MLIASLIYHLSAIHCSQVSKQYRNASIIDVSSLFNQSIVAFRFAFLDNSARALVNLVGNVQGTPKFTFKKLRPAWYRSTLRSV